MDPLFTGEMNNKCQRKDIPYDGGKLETRMETMIDEGNRLFELIAKGMASAIAIKAEPNGTETIEHPLFGKVEITKHKHVALNICRGCAVDTIAFLDELKCVLQDVVKLFDDSK